MQYDSVENQTNASLGGIAGEPPVRVSHRFPLRWEGWALPVLLCWKCHGATNPQSLLCLNGDGG